MTSSSISLDQRIEAMKSEYGDTVPVGEIGAVAARVAESLESKDVSKAELGKEVNEMLEFISRARDELATMRPRTITDRHIPSARDELDAVVKHTESAAGQIMDAADELGSIADTLEEPHKATIADLSTRIFEASSFQDITGQRVTKVVSVLQHIEQRLAALAEVIGDHEVHDENIEVFDETGEVVNEDALTHGPQLDGKGNSQDDIDALLASFD